MGSFRQILPNYSYREYEQWEGRWEVIRGIAISMSPMPSPKHQRVSAVLSELFRNEQLAEQITKSNFKKVIHFCGNISLGEVSDALTLTGKKAERFVVYETKLTPAKVKQKCHGILFSSPSAAESFYMENEPHAEVVSFAIGATTAKEIIKHHNNEIIVCEKPSQHEMISKVIERFKKEQV